MRILLLCLFIYYSISLFGQIENPKAQEYFDQGLIQYKSKHYQAADSLFELSIKTEPNLDAIFYKSISRVDLKKVCKKCNKNRISYKAGDMKAGKKYYSECFIYDSIVYNDISNSEKIFYCALKIPLCSGKKGVTFYFCKKRTKDGKISSFVLESDSTLSPNTNPIAKYPDLNSISSEQIYYLQTPDPPSFPGGEDARIRYMEEYIHYPDDAKENGISGVVWVSYIIDEQGKVTNPRIIKGISKSCDEMCLGMIKSMPLWSPGKEDGKAVKFKRECPTKFTLETVYVGRH